MTREFTCIICPNGCEITTEYEGETVLAVAGASCPRGEAYVRQELTDPRRTIASSVTIQGGTLPLASVRLDKPVPKPRIMDVMAEIRRVKLIAPVHSGDVVIENVLGLDSNVILTRSVETL